MSRTTVIQSYRGQSASSESVSLVCDQQRSPVRVCGEVKQPVAFREAMSVLHEVVASDLRYKPKDRTAYLAYQQMKKQSSGGEQARADYFDWLFRNDPLAWLVLDPVVTVHPDGVLFEVFSKDEGTYAQLKVARELFDEEGEWKCGTTNVDFSDELFAGLQTIRSSRPVKLSISPDAVSLQTTSTVVEKKIPVPDSWLRGFLQVASSASLSRAVVNLKPIDLYNILRQLRLNADQKKKGRAIRVELVPGEAPRLVLEPWETVLETSTPYTGSKPEVVRIWGRRRWGLVNRLLPFVEEVQLHLVASGMPSFLVLKAGLFTFTLGLTGFTSANWSRAMAFDQLLAVDEASAKVNKAIIAYLGKHWVCSKEELAKAVKTDLATVSSAVQALSLQGAICFDLASDLIRLRPLTSEPLSSDKLRYRSEVERVAHDLVFSKAVKLDTENVIHGTGTELVAKIKADKREYRTSFVLDDEGRVKQASCTCHQFRTHRLKEGPCAHLLALRMQYEITKKLRAGERGSSLRVETKTFAKRTDSGETITQISLNNKRLKVRWGPRTAERLRVQNLVFDSVSAAREAYLGRIEGLESKGYLDTSAS